MSRRKSEVKILSPLARLCRNAKAETKRSWPPCQTPISKSTPTKGIAIIKNSAAEFLDRISSPPLKVIYTVLSPSELDL
ncbi:hypothetical protein BCON_0044g00110 [Botryotinia convoluta]|uniref:Uncharacterized protein n=1 Tax=Botryotinia convoluta TaxID=54673 RepID=A0A4Z1IRR7_9HELO|nr:hypothetical protein BCON_0044g00110 [Botryotinia convoluta]